MRAQRRFVVRAETTSTEGSQVDVEALVKDLQAKVSRRSPPLADRFFRHSQRLLAIGLPCSVLRGCQVSDACRNGRRAAAARTRLLGPAPPPPPPPFKRPAAGAASAGVNVACTRAASRPQWDKVENKTSVIVYGAGGIVLLWLAATIVGALNNIPLVRQGIGTNS